MKIVVLNGSPRGNGDTSKMVRAFVDTAEQEGENTVRVFNVCWMQIKGCLACEYCHTLGKGKCVQKDDMSFVYEALEEADMLVLASPIYYHGISGQLKCVIDRFYALCYPKGPARLRKVAMFLSSGDADMYDGAKFSFYGDFVGYLKLEDCGVFTNHDSDYLEKIRVMASSL